MKNIKKISFLKFRPIQKKDLKKLYDLLNQLSVMDLDLIDKVQAQDDFKSNNSTNSIVGVCNFGSKKNIIVGYGSIVIENKIRGEKAGHIEDVVVLHDVRGEDIGTKLVQKLLEIAKKYKCYRVSLFCKEHLKDFYKINGFEVNSVAMKKWIT